MRAQTYAIWIHSGPAAPTSKRAPDQADAPFIDTLIAQLQYYPSFMTDIVYRDDGLLVNGIQRVVRITEQNDGMVVLETQESRFWVTQALYQRLVA
jgi:hypothetical protein